MGLRNLIERMRRVLLVSTKPDKEEFKQSVKITGIGIIIIGMIGFIIFMIIQLLGGL
jgi:protein transport protein SEC61 subunit gamma-like protein